MYPVLHGFRAGEVRGLVPAIAMLTGEFADGSDTSIHEIALMNALEQMYEIMHDSGISLGPKLAEFKKVHHHIFVGVSLLGHEVHGCHPIRSPIFGSAEVSLRGTFGHASPVL